MKVVGLDGREYKLDLKGKVVLDDDLRPRSKGHKTVRQLLKKLFPFERVLEEVFLPGCQTSLYLDFFVPSKRLAIEVQGEQHRSFSQHFHGSRQGFLEQKKRDVNKKQWCKNNNFILVTLHDNECEQWEQQLIRSRTTDGDDEAG